jgi:hypothetical protein
LKCIALRKSHTKSANKAIEGIMPVRIRDRIRATEASSATVLTYKAEYPRKKMLPAIRRERKPQRATRFVFGGAKFADLPYCLRKPVPP